MKTNPIYGDLAICLIACRSNGFNDSSVNRLIKCFNKPLKNLAKSFPEFWYDDFVQVGYIALLKAAKKFPESSDPKMFFSYAYKAVKAEMLKLHGRQVKSPLNTISLDAILFSNEEEGGYSYDIPEEKDYQNSILTSIDVDRILSSDNLRRRKFNEKEIIALNLSVSGHNITEISEKIDLSVSGTSKLVSGMRVKAKSLLASII